MEDDLLAFTGAGRFAPSCFGGSLGGLRLVSAFNGFPFRLEDLLGNFEGFLGCGGMGLPALTSLGGSLGGFFLGPREEDFALPTCGRVEEVDTLRGVREPLRTGRFFLIGLDV